MAAAPFDDQRYIVTSQLYYRYGYMREIETGELNLTYPVWWDRETFEMYTFPFALGGMDVSEDNILRSAKAISLNYFLDSTTEDDLRRFVTYFFVFAPMTNLCCSRNAVCNLPKNALCHSYFDANVASAI